MLRNNEQGLTLIETMLAVATLIIILPVTIFAFVRLARESSFFNVRQRLDHVMALTYSELSSELAAAESVAVSTSSWGINPSSFSFVDSDGVTVTIDVVQDIIVLPDGDQTVKRLRWRRGTEEAWLTDSDINITNWTAQVVRDGSFRLSGINIAATFSMLNKENVPFRNAESSLVLTVDIPVSVFEL